MKRYHYSKDEDDLVIRLHGLGWGQTEIGKAIGRSKGSVQSRKRLLGLTDIPLEDGFPTWVRFEDIRNPDADRLPLMGRV